MTPDLSSAKSRQHIERKDRGPKFVFSSFDLRLFPENFSEENEKMLIPDNSFFFEQLRNPSERGPFLYEDDLGRCPLGEGNEEKIGKKGDSNKKDDSQREEEALAPKNGFHDLFLSRYA